MYIYSKQEVCLQSGCQGLVLCCVLFSLYPFWYTANPRLYSALMSLSKCHGYSIISCGGVSSHLTFEFTFSSLFSSTLPLPPILLILILLCSIVQYSSRVLYSCKVTWMCFHYSPYWATSFLGSFYKWQVTHYNDTLSLSLCWNIFRWSLNIIQMSQKWHLKICIVVQLFTSAC